MYMVKKYIKYLCFILCIIIFKKVSSRAMSLNHFEEGDDMMSSKGEVSPRPTVFPRLYVGNVGYDVSCAERKSRSSIDPRLP